MEVWPPEKLKGNVLPVLLQILFSPVYLIYVIVDMTNRFDNFETITSGELGEFAGISLLSLIALGIIISICVNAYSDEMGAKKFNNKFQRTISAIGLIIGYLIGGYLFFALATYLIFKLYGIM